MKVPTLLVLSDSHGNIKNLLAALEWGKAQNIDILVFLGDGIPDISVAAALTGFSADTRLIRGNCDTEAREPYQETFVFNDQKFFLTHGHMMALSYSFDFLATAAKSAGAGIALFGHTHVPAKEELGGVLLVNPGSIGRPRGTTGPGFATIECPKDKKPEVKFWEIEAKRIVQIPE